jgi:hypothetical protein
VYAIKRALKSHGNVRMKTPPSPVSGASGRGARSFSVSMICRPCGLNRTVRDRIQ